MSMPKLSFSKRIFLTTYGVTNMKAKFNFEVHEPVPFIVHGTITTLTFKNYCRGYDAYMTIWKPVVGVRNLTKNLWL